MHNILIVDYGMANLRSVQKALQKVGAHAEITRDPDRVAQCDKLILPGVGAFRDAIAKLRETGLAEPIIQHVKNDKPFFGICLGLQLLFTTSQEDGTHAGLNVFPGDVVRFAPHPGLKVPHMGWNRLEMRTPAPELRDLPGEPFVYFVHSYFACPVDVTLVAAQADYGGLFTAAIWRGNVFATQFHPEKSQRVGLAMLQRFAER